MKDSLLINVIVRERPELIDFSIVSFSLNARNVARLYEHGTSSPDSRLAAAKACQDAGFEVRIRIDPMIPVEGWIMHYTKLILDMLDKIVPSRITIGSLRALQKTIKYAQDKSWITYVMKCGGDKTKWGRRVERKLRIKMFEIAIETLREAGYNNPIALCKEPLDVWSNLSERGYLDYPGSKGIWENVMCNCKL